MKRDNADKGTTPDTLRGHLCQQDGLQTHNHTGLHDAFHCYTHRHTHAGPTALRPGLPG